MRRPDLYKETKIKDLQPGELFVIGGSARNTFGEGEDVDLIMCLWNIQGDAEFYGSAVGKAKGYEYTEIGTLMQGGSYVGRLKQWSHCTVFRPVWVHPPGWQCP